VVFENGASGFNGEHSANDAPVPNRLLTEVCDAYDAIPARDLDAKPSADLPEPTYVKWNVDKVVAEALEAAHASARDIIDNASIHCLTVTSHGKKFIRANKFGPDSWMQMALQLAFYRDQGFSPCTYESATTRTFYHGRTETIRPGSLEANHFVKVMDDASVSAADKLEALREAAQAHTMYLQRCMLGRGVDRHLMGLRIVAMGAGLDPMPAIFTIPATAKAGNFILSTSQMNFTTEDYPGFGAPTEESYGTCYVCGLPNLLLATVTSSKKCKGKDAERFRNHLERALEDMRALVVSQSSKL
jgi:carnitine O-acetyltransferase